MPQSKRCEKANLSLHDPLPIFEFRKVLNAMYWVGGDVSFQWPKLKEKEGIDEDPPVFNIKTC